MKNYSIFLLFFIASLDCFAQKVVQKYDVLANVNKGDTLIISFSKEGDDALSIEWPAPNKESNDWYQIILGPSRYIQSSYIMTNGELASKTSTTFNYILKTLKNGNFIVPHGIIKDKRGDTNKVSATIIKKGTQQWKNRTKVTNNTAINKEDIRIEAFIDKNSVKLGDSLTLTFKLYTLVGLTQLNGNSLDLDACYFKNIDLSREKEFRLEWIGGKPWRVVEWTKYTIVPLRTGKIAIPQQLFTGIVLKKKQDVDPFESFFSGAQTYDEINIDIRSNKLEFTVYE